MNMLKLISLISFVLLLTGCADAITFEEAIARQNVNNVVGFWYGLWHGIIIFWAWLFSLFSDSHSIYAIYNNGGWYDFGYVLGATGMVGSTLQIMSRD